MPDAASYTESYQLERLVKSQSGHVPVPISLIEKPGSEARDIVDGTALWVKPKSEIKPEEYTDFYRGVVGSMTYRPRRSISALKAGKNTAFWPSFPVHVRSISSIRTARSV